MDSKERQAYTQKLMAALTGDGPPVVIAEAGEVVEPRLTSTDKRDRAKILLLRDRVRKSLATVTRPHGGKR